MRRVLGPEGELYEVSPSTDGIRKCPCGKCSYWFQPDEVTESTFTEWLSRFS
jgi:hypothetical protein